MHVCECVCVFVCVCVCVCPIAVVFLVVFLVWFLSEHLASGLAAAARPTGGGRTKRRPDAFARERVYQEIYSMLGERGGEGERGWRLASHW